VTSGAQRGVQLREVYSVGDLVPWVCNFVVDSKVGRIESWELLLVSTLNRALNEALQRLLSGGPAGLSLKCAPTLALR
jgi:hypothetical protein